MEWLLALAFVFGLMQDASGEYEQVLLAHAALEQQEIALYPDEQSAREAMAAEWTVRPSTVAQGDAFLVRASEPQTIDWNGASYELVPLGTGYYALLPVPIEMEPGRYAIGGAEVTIESKQFRVQHLQVTEEQAEMRRNTKRIEEDRLKTAEARSESAGEILFERFVKPLEGRLTTPYGFTRYVNGSYSGRHRAIDLAAPQGTPIAAAASGIVTLSEELYLTGNTIYIDHGMGLFSEYSHLSELLVEPGERVEAGQTIGLVGSTGFSTGPHLHFAFWLHGVQTNPDNLFDSSPFYWK